MSLSPISRLKIIAQEFIALADRNVKMVHRACSLTEFQKEILRSQVALELDRLKVQDRPDLAEELANYHNSILYVLWNNESNNRYHL